jgi:DNA polymerase III alpha subunit
MVQLTNLGHLCGGDWRGPRVDWRDLAPHAERLICLAGAPASSGLLGSYAEQADDPDEPTEALAIARRLANMYGDRLYVSLVFHGSDTDKVVNRGLLAIAQRLELGVVASNAVRFATPEDALPHTVLGAIRGGRRADGLMTQPGVGAELPMLALDGVRGQGYLKSAAAMWRLFGTQKPQALENTLEVARRCEFRLPLAEIAAPDQRYGPARLFGLQPAQDLFEQQLSDAVAEALPRRCAETGREPPNDDLRARLQAELDEICKAGLAELLLVAQQVGAACRERGIPVVARGSATCSLVVWVLGLVETCPLDDGLDGEMFVHDGRPELPDLDLEVPSAYEPTVAVLVQQAAAACWTNRSSADRSELPVVNAVRLGVNVSLGSRQAVRLTGAALGLEVPRVNALARQVPLLSSPGAIEQVMTRGPELGVGDSPQSEPFKSILSVAARLEGLPYRQGAHPSASTFSFFSRSALDWLPAQWVGADGPGRRRSFGGARHVAVAAQERANVAALAHPGSFRADRQVTHPLGVEDGNGDWPRPDLSGGGPVLAAQWDKSDMEALGLTRLDVCSSPSLGSAGILAEQGGVDAETAAAAWRLLEAGDTLCIAQVESLGMRQLFRRARELRDQHG